MGQFEIKDREKSYGDREIFIWPTRAPGMKGAVGSLTLRASPVKNYKGVILTEVAKNIRGVDR